MTTYDAPKMAVKLPTDAECTIVLSLAQARELPGMLGRIAPAMLKHWGFYSCKKDGVKTLYLLAPSYETRKALMNATLAVGRG